MLMRVLMLFLFLLIEKTAFSACETEFEPCKNKRLNLAIKDFQMDRTFGIRSSIDDPLIKSSDCQKYFRATKQEAKKYFQQPWVITSSEHHSIIAESSCILSGTLRTKTGKKAKWKFGEMGDGELLWSNGRVEYLYCPECVESFDKSAK